MTTGVPNVKELVLRQREETKKLAKSPPKGQARPPEARVAKFSNSGSLKMGFTSGVKVPDGTSEKIKEENAESRRRLAEGKAPIQSLIQVFAVKEDSLEVVSGPIMDGWELLSLDAYGFELQLNFTNPLFISADDVPDLLLI